MSGTEFILGLGSSDAQALQYFRRAIHALKAKPCLELTGLSQIYLSDAMLPPGEVPAAWRKNYFNMAASFCSRGVDAQEILELLGDVEKSLGRVAREKWAPREIDLDILSFGAQHLRSESLNLPHPGLIDRPFALLPHAELASDWVHPEAVSRQVYEQNLKTWGRAAELPFNTRRSELSLTQVVGIVNVTPDSSSDGRPWDEGSFLTQMRQLVERGASVLDLGAESTRPGAAIIDAAHEIARLDPAIKLLPQLRAEFPHLQFSLDSKNPQTVRWALQQWAWDYVNDVSGFDNAAMIEAVKESTARLVAMHSLCVPPRRDRQLPPELPASRQVFDWGMRKIEQLQRAGIDLQRIFLDPGVGFGKSVEQNFELIANARLFLRWPVPVWFGHSRKSFLSPDGSLPPAERDLETAQLSAELESCGVSYLRVHSPDNTLRAIASRKKLHGSGLWK